MSDLGGQAGNSGLSIVAKLLEALLKLLEKMYRVWETAPDRKLKLIQLKEAKDNESKKKALKEIDGAKGYINYKTLKKSGVPLTTLAIKMTEQEMKDIAADCKRYNVVMSGVKSDSVDGKKYYDLVIKTEDLPKVQEIVDRLNEKKMIANIDNQIETIKSKGDLSEQDKFDINALNKFKRDIQEKGKNKANEKVSNEACNDTASQTYQNRNKEMKLSEALNRETGRATDKDMTYYVVDAKDPTKYIKCHTYQDEYKDKPYIKTDYEVIKDNKVVLTTNDGRFDGRTKGYWDEQKEKMSKAGEFGSTFFKFYDIKEFEKFAQYVKTENDVELKEMLAEDKDYDKILNSLNKKLDENGFKMENGVVVDKATGRVPFIMEAMTMEQKAVISESVIIGEQIIVYENLKNITPEVQLSKIEILTADTNEKKVQAQFNYNVLKEKNDILNAKADNLIEQRQVVNSVQVDTMIQQEQQQSQDREEIQLEEEQSDGKITMADYVEEISDRKANDSAKDNDFDDKEVKNNVTKPLQNER